jgi:hypothetical protein
MEAGRDIIDEMGALASHLESGGDDEIARREAELLRRGIAEIRTLRAAPIKANGGS